MYICMPTIEEEMRKEIRKFVCHASTVCSLCNVYDYSCQFNRGFKQEDE